MAFCETASAGTVFCLNGCGSRCKDGGRDMPMWLLLLCMFSGVKRCWILAWSSHAEGYPSSCVCLNSITLKCIHMDRYFARTVNYLTVGYQISL